jgi:cation diffusion facilitator family transporter
MASASYGHVGDVQGEKRTVLIALAANAVIAVAKGAGGLVTGSSAMLAETAHSLADTVDQVLLLVSLRLGERQPDEEHPFGYGTDRFFWTFLVAVIIFLAGAIFSIGDGVLRLLGRNVLGSSGSGRIWIDFVVLGIAFASETISLARAWSQTRKAAREAGYGLVEYVRISKEPTTKMVLSEDAVAVAGVVVAFAGLGLQDLTGAQQWDAGAAIVIGLLLVYVAFALGRDIRGLLLGRRRGPISARQSAARSPSRTRSTTSSSSARCTSGRGRSSSPPASTSLTVSTRAGSRSSRTSSTANCARPTATSTRSSSTRPGLEATAVRRRPGSG